MKINLVISNKFFLFRIMVALILKTVTPTCLPTVTLRRILAISKREMLELQMLDLLTLSKVMKKPWRPLWQPLDPFPWLLMVSVSNFTEKV